MKDIPIDSDRQFITLISVDFSDYLQETKPDKKTMKVPHWLNIRAEKAEINFSKTMTEALMEKLRI